jgi:hypothetical protein
VPYIYSISELRELLRQASLKRRPPVACAIRRTATLFAVPGGPITRKYSRATALSATSSTSGSRSTSPREAAVTAERSLDEAANGLGVMEII